MEEDQIKGPTKGWQSAERLSRDHVGSQRKISRKLKALRLELITDISEQTDMDEEEAMTIVDAHLIKLHDRSGKTGPRAIRGSQEAIRMLSLESVRSGSDSDGQSKLANQMAGRGKVAIRKKEWRSGTDLSRDLIGGSEKINRKLKELRLELITDISEQMEMVV